MDLIRHIVTPNGPFLLLNDWCIANWIENENLLQDTEHSVQKYDRLLSAAKSLRPYQCDIIDGGSNLGSWTIPLAGQHADLTFHSFEVQRLIYHCFCGSIALNGLSNVQANLSALGDHTGHISISVPDYSNGGNFGAFESQPPVRNSDTAQWMTMTDRKDTVPLARLDDLHLSPLFIKLDVEGMEWSVLKGAAETIGIWQPLVWCESHKSDPTIVLPFMEDRGYITSLMDGHWMFLPRWAQKQESILSVIMS